MDGLIFLSSSVGVQYMLNQWWSLQFYSAHNSLCPAPLGVLAASLPRLLRIYGFLAQSCWHYRSSLFMTKKAEQFNRPSGGQLVLKKLAFALCLLLKQVPIRLNLWKRKTFFCRDETRHIVFFSPSTFTRHMTGSVESGKTETSSGEYRVTKLPNQMWAAEELCSTWSLLKERTHRQTERTVWESIFQACTLSFRLV